MPCQILVSNRSGLPSGEIVTIQSDSFEFSKNETMQQWISCGGDYNEWSRLFSLIVVLDKKESELNYLLEEMPDLSKKHYFIQPEKATPEYQELLNTGQIIVNFEKINEFLRAR